MTTSSNANALSVHIKPLATLSPPATSRAWQSAPHPNLPLLATGCADRTIRIYSLTSFTLLHTLERGHKRSVRCCAWKPPPFDERQAQAQSAGTGGRRLPKTPPILATGSFDATTAIWVGPAREGHADDAHDEEEEGYSRGVDRDHRSDEEEGEEEEEYRFAVVLEGHDSEVKSLAWSAHGTFLATCSRDKSVWIWECLDTSVPLGFPGAGAVEDEDNYETVAVLQEHDGDVKCVAWHPEDEHCLASSSYDEMVRVWREDSDGEWRCVGVCNGHEGTVWCVAWEPVVDESAPAGRDRVDPSPMDDDGEVGLVSGPRLLTCADDRTLRIWRRKPKPPQRQQDGPRMPNIIRSASDEEEWYEEGRLPQAHERAVYTVAWSRTSRRVVSAGSDGKIVVYEERLRQDADTDVDGDQTMGNGHAEGPGDDKDGQLKEWVVVAEFENAHGVFEVNHVAWAPRWDRGKKENEEVIVTTGDDGEVRVWTLEGV